jgi:hypothetical protein
MAERLGREECACVTLSKPCTAGLVLWHGMIPSFSKQNRLFPSHAALSRLDNHVAHHLFGDNDVASGMLRGDG